MTGIMNNYYIPFFAAKIQINSETARNLNAKSKKRIKKRRCERAIQTHFSYPGKTITDIINQFKTISITKSKAKSGTFVRF